MSQIKSARHAPALAVYCAALLLMVCSALLPLHTTAAMRQQAPVWQKVAPVGEEFTVLMPQRATHTRRLLPFAERSTLSVFSYDATAAGVRYIVLAIKHTPHEASTEHADLTVFADGLRYAIRQHDPSATITASAVTCQSSAADTATPPHSTSRSC